MHGHALACALGAALLAACGAPARADSAADFETEVLPYFERNCFRCHGPDDQESDFRIDTLSRDFEAGAATDHWLEVIARIKAGEMPPRSQKDRPAASESSRIVEWLTARIQEADRARLARRGPVSHYRLSRVEYAKTIRDLLGISFDATGPGGLIADDVWQGFERIGSVLSLSPAHIDRYFAAAERILAEAFPETPPTRRRMRRSAIDLAGGPDTYGAERFAKLERAGTDKRIRLDLWPGQGARVSAATPPGRYRVRVQVSGLAATDGRRPHLVVEDTARDRVLFEHDVVTREHAPVVLEFETHLSEGEHELSLTNEVSGPPLLARLGRTGHAPFLSLAEGRIPWQIELIDDSGHLLQPVLILDWVEWDGPLPRPTTDDYLGDGIAGLARFAERAFRRPLRKGELAPYANLVASEIQRGQSQRSALLSAMLAILCSSDFLYLVEGSPGRPGLDDWELASRLSYFLWSTMPDAELLDLARAGRLHEREVLRWQVERMLADERAAALAREFPRQWLELGRVGTFPPDADLYPDYDAHLERSMVRETLEFFAEVLRRNLTLREFLVSDWTVVDPRLARHYGILGVTEDRFQVVELAPEHHRGGILTQASVLSLTSDGVRHRPVHRGVWLSQAILGRTPPSPPASVEPIEPIAAGAVKSSFRDQLEAHRRDPTCASCHAKIDPLGLAFDNYDAIGRWRTREHVPSGTGEDPPVDASGALPDGSTFRDARGLLALLLADIDTFHAAFVEKLAAFALRRPMTAGDRRSLAAIVETSKAHDYRVRDLVETLVLSDLFQHH